MIIMKKIVILTPVYNEEKNIVIFYDRIKKIIDQLADKYAEINLYR